VTLLDVNNKHPEMPSDTTVYTVTEDARLGLVVVDRFYAPDKDDTSTPNGKVSYEILSIKEGKTIGEIIIRKVKANIISFVNMPALGGNNLPDKDPSDIFQIESYGDFYGRIKVGKALIGYHGDWRVEIRVSYFCNTRRGWLFHKIACNPTRAGFKSFWQRCVGELPPKLYQT
jgi:hypothetical protein